MDIVFVTAPNGTNSEFCVIIEIAKSLNFHNEMYRCISFRYDGLVSFFEVIERLQQTAERRRFSGLKKWIDIAILLFILIAIDEAGGSMEHIILSFLWEMKERKTFC